ncbi:MAG: pyridoxal phosphate-dependent aminotransferase [Xanthomonadales bacterium]|nr:pyridoxal phosphate-dependent aminotransferase [Xanthomonadales bacterium]
MPDYDFTTLVDRSGMSSAKWNAMRRANPEVPPGIAPFSVADLDLPHPPEIIDGLKAFIEETPLGYTAPSAAFTNAVTGWMQRRHGWTVDADWLVQTPGVVPALFTAVRAFSEPGDGVIVQTPAYHPFYLAIEKNRRRVVRNPLRLDEGRFTIDFGQLERLAAEPANKLLLFCSPHNPTGRVWTPDELRRLAEIVIAHDLVLVSDEIHFDLVLPGHRHTVMSTLGAEIAARTLVCTAPSKTFNLAGLGASNIVISDPELRRRFTAERDATGFFFLTAPAYKGCELAYTKGEAWLDGLLGLIDRNHRLTRRFMADHLPQVTVFDLEGTYLQWMDFRGLGLGAPELRAIHQREALVFFEEGTTFGEEGAGFERMNIAAPTAAVEAALERLARAHRR